MLADDGALEQGLRILRRQKLIFIQAVVLVPLGVLALSLSQDERYTATATLLFRESPSGLLDGTASEGFVDPAREAATNDELVALPVVAERAAEELGGEVTSSGVFNSVSVDSGSGADIAEISATTSSPTLSAQMADAYGNAYIEFRRDADRRQIGEALDLVERRLSNLSPQERGGPQEAELEDRLQSLQLVRSLQTGKAELVQPASVPLSPSSPKITRNLIIGLFLGGLLGFGLAALRYRMDDRLSSVEEVERTFELPVLARVPWSRSLRRFSAIAEGAAALPSHDQAGRGPELFQAVEAFRALRVNLRYFNVDQQRRSILVASPEPGDGKSTIARCLASTMAGMGDDVILVDADLHKNRIPTNSERGLSSVLAGMPLGPALIEIEIGPEMSAGGRTLTVLPSGPTPPNPLELFESRRMRALLEELEEGFETVIVDSPALGVVSDTLSLVPHVSATIAVSSLGRTTRSGAREFMKQLSLLGTTPVGVIVNFAEARRGGDYYYQRSRALVDS